MSAPKMEKQTSSSILQNVSQVFGSTDKPKVQLHRLNLRDRLKIERSLQQRLYRAALFLMVMIFYLASLGVYDPLPEIAHVHQNLRAQYGLHEEALAELRTNDQVLQYMQSFIEASYNMAPALVDATTLNSIDLLRCVDPNTEDVCRLKYWEFPIRRPTSPGYVTAQSIMSENPGIVGLDVTSPIIMESRMKFPFAQVVPLSPIVWQVRAPQVPCSGFGNKYNDEILGAGRCTPGDRCGLESTTSFDTELPNHSGFRSIYATYGGDVINCYDRRQQATTFYDRSWYPEATLSDLRDGRLRRSTKIQGKEIFWKFISDVRYLQAPIPGTIAIPLNATPCEQCAEYVWPFCVDPVEEGESHPMWQEDASSGGADKACSLRRLWNRQYLEASSRQNTFLTAETTELTIASMIITPQMEGLADITTLVRVVFNIGQSGIIRATASMESVSETMLGPWLICVMVTIFLNLAYVVIAIKLVRNGDHKREGGGGLSMFIFDLLSSAAVQVHLVWNMFLEFQPPHVISELLDAFKEDDMDTYFSAFQEILDYTLALANLKGVGFFLVLILFFRFIHLLAFHPRLGLIVAVTSECLDDCFHFLIQFLLFLGVLSFLGHWSFGADKVAYSTMTHASYTLVKYFVGDFEFSEEPLEFSYFCYVLIYLVVAFIMMVNFLLAIIVDAYGKVTERTQADQTEMNVVMDIWDTVRHFHHRHARGWPTAAEVLEHIQKSRPDGVRLADMPAVTSEELYEQLRSTDQKRRFSSEEDAQEYLKTFAWKLRVDDTWYLMETRREYLFLPGHYFGEDSADPLGAQFHVPPKKTALEEAKEDEQAVEDGKEESEASRDPSERNYALLQELLEQHRVTEETHSVILKRLDRAVQDNTSAMQYLDEKLDRLQQELTKAQLQQPGTTPRIGTGDSFASRGAQVSSSAGAQLPREKSRSRNKMSPVEAIQDPWAPLALPQEASSTESLRTPQGTDPTMRIPTMSPKLFKEELTL